MKHLQQWLNDQQRIFDMRIESVPHQPNQFQSKMWRVSDPNGFGLPFSLSANAEGEASLLFVDDLFTFQRLNIAEGFGPDFILRVAEAIMAGGFEVSRSKLTHVPSVSFRDDEIGRTAIGTIALLTYLTSKGRIESRLQQALAGYSRLG